MTERGARASAAAGMPQTLALEWRENFRKALPGAKNVYVAGREHEDVLCEVMSVVPAMHLPWRYTARQERECPPWKCTAVWFLNRSVPDGEITQRTGDFALLEKAINTISQDKERARYTLLVNPDGMCYSPNRVGGDHHVSVDGHHFTFSVRRGGPARHLHLLAVKHN
nr:hypothetical protein TetV2_00387 [Oceanusvirus sp.]